MAEAAVSTVLDKLASLITEQVGEKVRLLLGVDEEVKKLTGNFQAIKSVLEDAECKQVKEKAVGEWLDNLKEKAVGEWLDNLKDVSYDIEDVLDEWNTAIQKLRIMEAENSSNAFMLLTKVCSLMSCSHLCCKQVVIRHDIANKIKDLNQALEAIAMRKNNLHLRSINGTRKVEWEISQITTSLVDESEIHGRDNDKKVIKNLLLSESSNGPTSLPIISIVGLGGIGKTTLAQQVFNDLEVTAHFGDMKIWVCVSYLFDKIRIGKAILESIRNAAPNLNELQTVIKNLHESIKDKKFLLVLDDVWIEDSRKWEELEKCLKCGSKESRVLVTTRNRNVAKVMGSTDIIEVTTLSDDKCWSLFSQISFCGRKREECQKLEVVGRKIVEKCKGLPLAVKTFAGLLRFEKTIKEWQRVLDSEMWELKVAQSQIFTPLLISYFYLPSELKRCFLYCAIFPKDYDISKKELIQLWMAQDYLKLKVQNKDMELVGEEYFEKLVMLSFFQDFDTNPDGSIKTCKMHDMVHDLAQYINKECFDVEVDNVGVFRSKSDYEKARHTMIMLRGKDSFPISYFYENRLRSLVFDCNDSDKHKYTDISKLSDHMSCLRALKFCHNSIEAIPTGINKLIHLRYLNISGNDDIKELPEAVCELYNLQTLNINLCYGLKKLPEEIGKLVNLRHLINYGCINLEYMSKGIERLTCLRTLGNVVVSGDKKACKFECLRDLNHLGDLGITCRGGVDVGDINKEEFNNKTKLVNLRIELSSTEDVSNTNEEALEDFQPPPNLEQLGLTGYRGASRLSLNWMMSLTKLRELDLSSWSGFERLSLGKLPCLESLSIKEMGSVKSVGDEFVGMESNNIAFPNLQSLEFVGMEDWERWDCGASGRGEEQIMPLLRSLDIRGCPKLKTLPDYLLQSTTLEELDIHYCPILERRYKVEKAENWVKDCGFPKIIIHSFGDDLESSSSSLVADN